MSRRITIELGKDAADALTRIMAYTDTDERVEVIRHALAVYACLLDARKMGYSCRMVNVHEPDKGYDLQIPPFDKIQEPTR